MLEQTNLSLNLLKAWCWRYPCTIIYIISIIAINNVFVYAPNVSIIGSPVSTGDFVVGAVYVLRDFVQREIGHRVIIAMVAGCFLSYALADKQVAIASVSAFFVGELIDWVIYTFSGKPLSQRLLWSSSLSAPVDSFVFLYLTNMLNPVGLVALISGKFIGIFALWLSWRLKAPLAKSS